MNSAAVAMGAGANNGTAVITTAGYIADFSADTGTTGTFTITNSGAAATLGGGAGADTITGGTGADTITGGAGADSIVGGSGNDVISGGSGADTITGDAGADAITLSVDATTDDIIVADGASVAYSAITLAGTVFAASDTITFGNGVEVITNFLAGALASGGDTLDLITAATIPTTAIGVTATAMTTGVTYMLSGAYTSSTGAFVITASGGADTLLVSDAGTTASALDTWIVLSGVVNTALVAANFI